MALLREKLAKEQQRARAAEATLAAQQQMQQLLQSAVQAVLLTRGSAQVCAAVWTLASHLSCVNSLQTCDSIC